MARAALASQPLQMPRLGGPYNWTGDTTWKAGKSIWLWVYTTYKNGDDWGILGDGLWHCFNHIMMIIMWCFYGIIMGWLSMGYSDFNMIIMIIMWWCVFLIKWWWLSWLRCGDHFYDYNGFIIENWFFWCTKVVILFHCHVWLPEGNPQTPWFM